VKKHLSVDFATFELYFFEIVIQIICANHMPKMKGHWWFCKSRTVGVLQLQKECMEIVWMLVLQYMTSFEWVSYDLGSAFGNKKQKTNSKTVSCTLCTESAFVRCFHIPNKLFLHSCIAVFSVLLRFHYKYDCNKTKAMHKQCQALGLFLPWGLLFCLKYLWSVNKIHIFYVNITLYF